MKIYCHRAFPPGWYFQQDKSLSFEELRNLAIGQGLMTEEQARQQDDRLAVLERLIAKGEPALVPFLGVVLSLERLQLMHWDERMLCDRTIHATDEERRLLAVRWAEQDAFDARTKHLGRWEREELEIKEGRRSREDVEVARETSRKSEAAVALANGKLETVGDA